MTPTERLAQAFDEHAARVAASVGTLHREIEALLPELAREQLTAALANLTTSNALERKPLVTAAPSSVPALVYGKDFAHRGDITPDKKMPDKKMRATMKCRKCGALGFRSDGCGKTHNLTSSLEAEPEDDDEEPATSTTVEVKPPPLPKLDRFAAIEARATARTAARMDTRGGPTRGAPRPVRTDGDAQRLVTPALPTPKATFTF